MDADRICQELARLREGGVELERLLACAVELVHESSPRFHWTGVYELYPDGILRLGPFIGPATDHVFIAVGKGICGTAVAERKNMNIPDVTKARNYLACSAATRSELVVLIRKDDRIFAQIDIDSHETAAFDDAAVRQVEQVADWLASVYHERETPLHDAGGRR